MMNFAVFSSLQLVFVVLINMKLIDTTSNQTSEHKTNNHSCYICEEPLVGYTDHLNSCRFFNKSSQIGLSYIKPCANNDDNYTGEYECRKLVISHRSVDTYLRRDCAPKGLCSWKDKTDAMINTPESNCVYTDDDEQKLECIYCCDTPMCNRTMSDFTFDYFLVIILLSTYSWNHSY